MLNDSSLVCSLNHYYAPSGHLFFSGREHVSYLTLDASYEFADN